MNRRDRRRSKPPRALLDFTRAYRCPDCLSETAEPFRDEYGIWHTFVHHDETCPTYRLLRTEGRAT